MVDTMKARPPRHPAGVAAALLERWKDADRNNRPTAELRLVSPSGGPSYWRLLLAGRVRHAPVTVVVAEYAAGPSPPATERAAGPVYRVELAPAGGPRPGLDAVVRAGVDAWAGLDAGRLTLPPASGLDGGRSAAAGPRVA